MGISFLMTFLFRWFDYAWLVINPALKRELGLILTQRMMTHSVSLTHNHFSGNLANKIKDTMSGVPDLVRLIGYRFFSHIMTVLIAIGIFWSIHPKIALALLIWSIGFILFSLTIGKKGRKLSHQAAEVRSTIVGQIVDILGNLINVKLFSAKETESKKLKKSLDTYVIVDRKRDWFFFFVFSVQGFSFSAYTTLILYWLISGYETGIFSAGDFVAILAINVEIIHCLWTLSEDVGKASEIAGDITQGLRVVLSPLDVKDVPNAKPLTPLKKGDLEFKDVQFGYKETHTPLFKNLSVKINSGEKVGLVGLSGSGKTTFINLVLRLFDIQKGSIALGGQNIAECTQDSLRATIGVIPQDPSLFHRTLMENIRYGHPEATDTQVMQAAKLAHAHEFIEELPHQYESCVGERGVKLSGGQRQRIAIARAILKNAPVLILDEATSQLDSITEQTIQEAMAGVMSTKTVLVVAHRLSTLLSMDRILVFDKGRIVEEGTHKGLLAQKGLYKTMWEAQIGGFLPETLY
ncbi:MAG: ABC transporter ATP-binding protein [bacterium]|nr:ABC transporter ATP-binding protein [bacterium]